MASSIFVKLKSLLDSPKGQKMIRLQIPAYTIGLIQPTSQKLSYEAQHPSHGRDQPLLGVQVVRVEPRVGPTPTAGPPVGAPRRVVAVARVRVLASHLHGVRRHGHHRSEARHSVGFSRVGVRGSWYHRNTLVWGTGLARHWNHVGGALAGGVGQHVGVELQQSVHQQTLVVGFRRFGVPPAPVPRVADIAPPV